MPTSTNELVLRKELEAYMNVGTPAAYNLIGEGFTTFDESKNPKEYSRKYVNETSERTDVIGMSPSIGYALDVYTEDPVVSEIVAITDDELLGSAACRDVVVVQKWQPDATAGTYVAYKRTYAIIPNAKGNGTDALSYTGTLKCIGDQVKGTFVIATKTFTPDA